MTVVTEVQKRSVTLIALATVFKAVQLGVIGVLIGLGLAGGVQAFIAARGPAVAHLWAGPAEPFEVRRGEQFRVIMQYEKTAECLGSWAYFARWAGEDTWTALGSGPAGANAPGRYTFRHTFSVPRDAPIGDAAVVEVVQMDCGAWRTTASRSPEVRFRVVP